MTPGLIVNPRLVNQGGELERDLRINGGRIEQFGRGQSRRCGENGFDGATRRLLPACSTFKCVSSHLASNPGRSL